MIIFELTGDDAMSKTEVKPISLEVLDLQSGEAVASANVTHTPPSGSALTIPKTVSSPFVHMLFGPFAVAGTHYVKVQPVGDAATPSKPEALYIIEVRDV